MNRPDVESAIDSVPELEVIREELFVYETLLLRWQSKVNLVGRSTGADIWRRHFGDSLQLAAHAPIEKVWADLGSGAGFPGLVIALFQRKRVAGEMHLIESDRRKASFLREVSRETGANAIKHAARCEDVLAEVKPGVIVSRAMASLPTLLELSKAHVEKGAIALFPKGRDVASELTATPTPSNFLVELLPSKIDEASSIVRIQAG